MIRFELLGGLDRGFESCGCERGEERGCNRRIDLTPADVQAVLAAAVDDGLAGAVITGRGVATLVVHLQTPPAAPAGGYALQQCGAFPHSASGLMSPWPRVLPQALLVGLERRPVDVAGVMIADKDGPFGARTLFGSFAHAPALIDVRELLRSAIHVDAGIERVGQNLMDLRIRGCYPPDLLKRVRMQREAQALRAEPQPYAPCRAHLGEALKDGADCRTHRLIGMQQHLAIPLAPHQADRQPAAQFAAGGLVADPTEQPRPKHVQFRFRHRAFQAQHQPVVEQSGVINPVGIADQRVGDPAQVEEPIPVGIVTRQARDFQPEHDADQAERDFRDHARKAGTVGEAGTGDAKIFVKDLDLRARPSEFHRALSEMVLPRCRLTVVLDLRAAGLAHIDDGATTKMIGCDLGMFTHDFAPVRRWSWRSAGPAALSLLPAAPRRGRSILGRRLRAPALRESSAVAWRGSCGVGRRGTSAAASRRRRASTTVRVWSNCAQEASNGG